MLWLLFALICTLTGVATDDHKEERASFIENEIKNSASKLLHLRGGQPLDIPIDIDLVFIGFDGKGAFQYTLDENKLEDLLIENHEVRRPIARETGEPLSTQYLVDYTIIDPSNMENADVLKNSLTELEALMQNKFRRANKPSLLADTLFGKDGYDWATYSIDAATLEPKLDQIVHETLSRKKKIPGAPKWFDRNVIVIMNPCKRRMIPFNHSLENLENYPNFDIQQWNKSLTPDDRIPCCLRLEYNVKSAMKEEAGFGYYYTYRGRGMSANWVSHKNYAVIDISAGPVKFGKEMAPSGAVSPHSLPRILDVLYEGTSPVAVHKGKLSSEFAQHVSEVRDTMFRGKLAAAVVSCVHHLFLNDVWIENALDMRRIMVPLIVLRNHADFNPLGQNEKHSINASAIQEQMRTLVNTENLIVAESLHSLHQHKPLAVALYKSIVARSEAVVQSEDGKSFIHARLQYYVDEDILLREFTLAADVLSAAWIEDEKYRKEMWERRKGELRRPSKLTRTVPVFILSLKDVPFNLAFQHNELVVSNGEVVIVLQTIGTIEEQVIDGKYSGHFIGREEVVPCISGEAEWKLQIVVSTLDVQRHVVAGLTTALTGLPPPYELHHPNRGIVENWLWTVGHTPFGPYSNCRTLSLLATHAALRNALLGRLENLLRQMRETVHMMDYFVEEYATAFKLQDNEVEQLQREVNWLDLLYKKSEAFIEPPLPADVVKEIEDIITKLEASLIKLSHEMFDVDFADAEETLRSMGQLVNSFRSRVWNEILQARTRLRCCRMEYKQESDGTKRGVYWLVAGVVVLAVMIYIRIPVIEKIRGYPLG